MNNTVSSDSIDIEKLLADREAFNEFVYTPLAEATKEIAARHCVAELDKYVEGFLPEGLLQTIKGKRCALLHRPLITENYEVLTFVDTVHSVNLEPIFLEYNEDKYVTRNEWKYTLGRMGFYFGKGRKGGKKIMYLNSINFTESDGKKLSEVATLWGQSLINFHHQIFLKRFPKLIGHFYDGSKWYFHKGGTPQTYYESFFHLFLYHGVLFENFLLCGTELPFTREVILPALIHIRKKTGIKPLIVALEPVETENDSLWMCHPPDMLEYIKKELGVAIS